MTDIEREREREREREKRVRIVFVMFLCVRLCRFCVVEGFPSEMLSIYCPILIIEKETVPRAQSLNFLLYSEPEHVVQN